MFFFLQINLPDLAFLLQTRDFLCQREVHPNLKFFLNIMWQEVARSKTRYLLSFKAAFGEVILPMIEKNDVLSIGLKLNRL